MRNGTAEIDGHLIKQAVRGGQSRVSSSDMQHARDRDMIHTPKTNQSIKSTDRNAYEENSDDPETIPGLKENQIGFNMLEQENKIKSPIIISNLNSQGNLNSLGRPSAGRNKGQHRTQSSFQSEEYGTIGGEKEGSQGSQDARDDKHK